MVFFNCDGCGEALKKNQVEKHSFRCRSDAYSCIDCQVVFTRITYAQHVKCITENQKYGGSGYIEKEAKGELKQNAWIEQVQAAIEFVKEPKLKQLLQRIAGYGNIPRKESKFINFLSNSCSVRDKSLCQQAWNAIAAEAEKLRQNNIQKANAGKANGKNLTNGSTASKSGESGKKEEKEEQKQIESISEKANGNGHVADEDNCETQENNSSELLPFKWKKAIKRRLQEAGGEMKLKKLRKSVSEAYREKHGLEEVDDSVVKQQIEQTLQATSSVTVEGKSAKLVQNQDE
ncbi:hypothetical protein WR25_21551 [Diploscapter pachys]|uniref:Uncharacterized protein n=1 Tax=Diploscapter pachys TaxID=2018661 RepID=A0A2A2JNM6_9BILA|nr:hypothetical protein WR25_21551 [Diploscapter pachys]